MEAHNNKKGDGYDAVASEFEGTLLKRLDPFPYFMLVAFEASGLLRFGILLLLWPVVRLLDAVGKGDAGLRLMAFVATAGVKMSKIQVVARAVLPKFYMEDMDMEAWRVFSRYERRVVVSKCPRVMVDWFAKEHLRVDEVVGPELQVNRFGYATGLLEWEGSSCDRVEGVFGEEKPDMGLGRPSPSSFLPLCKDQQHPPFNNNRKSMPTSPDLHLNRPLPVIFHDGRLVPLPTPFTSLLIILWIPLGVLVAAVRISVGLVLPWWVIPYTSRLFGGGVVIRGPQPPPPSPTSGTGGVLFVCTHRTLMDPVVLSNVLGRQVPAVTYSISRLSEILSPIPTVRLSRDRRTDADRIRRELAKGDLVICPEGTTCREPFLLRFSALFAELTDRIVPVAMNYRVGFFHATTAGGWKALDPIFFFMNPRPVYEVTFLSQLPAEATCTAGGRSPHEVANYVQRILAASLGFECTNYTRRDKYRVLAGNDGTVTPRRITADATAPVVKRMREAWFAVRNRVAMFWTTMVSRD